MAMRPQRNLRVAAAAATVALSISAAACATAGTADRPPASTNQPAPASTAPDADPDSVVAAHAGEEWYLGTVPAAPVAADASLEPVRIGMINQEQTPLGSYPEMRAAVEAAVAWVNAELGGVAGRPIELVTCVTRFSPDESRECAESLVAQGVVAFAGGVDVMGSASIAAIEAAGLVLVGGIPVSIEEQRSRSAFFFSGGDAGALAAFAAHAAERGAAAITIAYGEEIPAFEIAARDYGAIVARHLGLEVDLAPFSILETDFEALVRNAAARGSDGVMVLAATQSCVPVMSAMRDHAPSLALYLTGACAAADTLTAAGTAADGVVFNAEGPVDGDVSDADIYLDVVTRYATEPAGGAGTVAFRGFMNLYSLILDAADRGQVSAAGITELARSAADRSSFWGHPFTCDGAQVPGLVALCAPQQILFTIGQTPSGFTSITDWIATDELFAAALR
ncbi:MAG: ABC transporter substrate-binding protein [Ilumatobacteraceae bacterium]